jgi:hypothetical protein
MVAALQYGRLYDRQRKHEREVLAGACTSAIFKNIPVTIQVCNRQQSYEYFDSGKKLPLTTKICFNVTWELEVILKPGNEWNCFGVLSRHCLGKG